MGAWPRGGLALVVAVAWVSLGVQVRVLLGSRGLCRSATDRGGACADGRSACRCADAVLASFGRGSALAGRSLARRWRSRRCRGLRPRVCFGLSTRSTFRRHGGARFPVVPVGQPALECGFLATFLPTDRRRAAGAPPVPAGAVQAVLRVGHRQVAVAAARLAGRQRDDVLYETAPLPTWLAWYAHHLPAGGTTSRAGPRWCSSWSCRSRSSARARAADRRGVFTAFQIITPPPPTTASSATWRSRCTCSCSMTATSSAPRARRARPPSPCAAPEGLLARRPPPRPRPARRAARRRWQGRGAAAAALFAWCPLVGRGSPPSPNRAAPGNRRRRCSSSTSASTRQQLSPVPVDHARADRARIPDLAAGRRRQLTQRRRRRRALERARPPPQAGRPRARARLRRAPPAPRRFSALVLRPRVSNGAADLRLHAGRADVRRSGDRAAAVPRTAPRTPPRCGIVYWRYRFASAAERAPPAPGGARAVATTRAIPLRYADQIDDRRRPHRCIEAANTDAQGFPRHALPDVFLDLLGFGLVIPFLPGMARRLGAGDFVATLPGAVYSLMQFLFIPIWGRLSDRVGRRPVLLWSIAATAAGMALLGVAPTLLLLSGGAHLQRHRHRQHRGRAGLHRRRHAAREPRARHGRSSASPSGCGSSSARSSAASCRASRSSGARERCPALVAAGPLARSTCCSRCAPCPSRCRPRRAASRCGARSPIESAAFRAAVARSRHRRAIGINFMMVLWFAGMEQTFRLFTADGFGMSDAATGRDVRPGRNRRRAWCRGAGARASRPGSARRASCRPGSSSRRCAFALLGLSPPFGACGEAGAVRLGRPDRARQRPTHPVAAGIRLAARQREDAGGHAGDAAVGVGAGARCGPDRRAACSTPAIDPARALSRRARSGLLAAGAPRRRSASPCRGAARPSAAGPATPVPPLARCAARPASSRTRAHARRGCGRCASPRRAPCRRPPGTRCSVIVALGDRRDAQADGDRDVLAAEAELALLDRAPQPLGDDLRAGQIGAAAKDRELLAAEARQHVFGAQQRRHHLRQLGQHEVARRVAVGVVDLLEVIDVDEDQRQRPSRGARANANSFSR